MNLITPIEVAAKAPVDPNYDSGLFEPYIDIAEIKLLTECCFGDEFYQDLVCDIVSNEGAWDVCTTYDTDDVVIFGCNYYIALSDGIIGEPPTNTTCWAITQKFNNAAYQDLWDKYLLKYMAFSVLHCSGGSAYRFSTQGVMRNNANHSEPVDKDGLLQAMKMLTDSTEALRQGMHVYLIRVNEAKDINNPELFPLYPPNEGCSTGCDKKLKRNPVNIAIPKNNNRLSRGFEQYVTEKRWNLHDGRKDKDCC